MRNTLLTVFLVGLLAAVLVWLRLPGTSDVMSPPAATKPVPTTVAPGAEEAVTAPEAPRTSSQPDAATPAEAAETTPDGPAALWAEAGDVPDSARPPRNTRVEDQHLVTMNRAQLLALEPGDTAEIWIPELGEPVTIEIETVSNLPSGNRSIRGAVDGVQPFSFVMTVGKTAIFATIGTPAGVFNLRGNTEFAWLVSSRALRELINPDKPDYRIPNA